MNTLIIKVPLRGWMLLKILVLWSLSIVGFGLVSICYAAPQPTASKVPAASTHSEDDDEIPAYEKVKPKWALELTYAQNTFTKSPTIANSSVSIQGASIIFEYQPPFVQKYGVLGLGAMASVYNVSPSSVLTQSLLSFFSAGAQIRYQAKYFREQPVVPYFGYGFEYFEYQFINANWSNFIRSGPIVGIMFLINAFDHDSAHELFVDSGIARTYIVAETRGSSSGDQTLAISPLDWFFGIRFEF